MHEIEQLNHKLMLQEKRPINYLMSTFCATGIVFGIAVFYSTIFNWRAQSRAINMLNMLFASGLCVGNVMYLKTNLVDRTVPPPPP
jgi:hypothetical protein